MKNQLNKMITAYQSRIVDIEGNYRYTQDTHSGRTDYKKKSQIDVKLVDIYEDFIADLKRLNNPFELHTITHSYFCDGQESNVVIGVFFKESLPNAAEAILELFGDAHSGLSFDESTGNFSILYSKDDVGMFYSGTFVVGELKL